MAPPSREYTRVALAQLDYQPAAVIGGRSPLSDPLFGVEAGEGLIPRDGIVPEAYRAPLRALRSRLRAAYHAQLRLRLDALVAACRRWGAKVLILPEYSVPWDLLEELATGTGDLLVVAGSHAVDRAARLDRVHEALGAPSEPPLGESVCPVLSEGRLVGLQAKLLASPFEDRLKTGHGWAPTEGRPPVPGPFAVLTALDFVSRAGVPVADLVDLSTCRWVAVVGYGALHELPGRRGSPAEEARRARLPVLYAADAGAGGTAVYATPERPAELAAFPDRPGWLGPSEEGLVIADVDLCAVRGEAVVAPGGAAPVRPVALPSLVYPSRAPDDLYATWLEDVAPLLERHDATEELIDAIAAAETALLDAGEAHGAGARRRRLWRLLTDLDRGGVTSTGQLRAALGEVVLPAEALPMPTVRRALSAVAARVVGEWLRSPEAAVFRPVEARLRGAAAPVLEPEAGAWSREGLAAIAAIVNPPRPSLLPPPPVEAPEVHVREALRGSIDVSAIDALEVERFELHFAPDAGRLAGRKVADPAAGGRGGRRHAPMRVELSAEDRRAAREVDALRDLALAEGATAASAVRVQDRRRNIEALLALATWEGRRRLMGRLVAWDGRDRLMDLAAHLELYVLGGELTSALQDDCLPDLEEGIELLSDEDVAQRVADLLPRFDEAFEAARRLRAERLATTDGRAARIDLCRPAVPREEGCAALDAWVAGPRRPCVVQGGFGSGKSTLVAEWACRRWSRRTAPLPLVVDLAASSPARSPVSMMLAAAGLPDRPEGRAALRLLLDHGALVPCFDGLDEMALRLEPYELPGRLAELLESARGGHVLFSTRSLLFQPDGPLPEAVAAELRRLFDGPPAADRLDVQPLDREEVLALAASLRDGDPDEALARLATAHPIDELAASPLLLAMTLRTLDDLDPHGRGGHVDVHEAFLRRWLEVSRAGDRERLSDDQKEAVPEALAAELHAAGGTSCPAEAVAARLRRSSVPPGDAPLDRAAILSADGGALVVEPEPGALRFAHRAFQDFFLARFLLRAIAEDVEEALSSRPVPPTAVATLAELLRRRGEPERARTVVILQRWLTEGRAARGESRTALGRTATAAANAARLLVDLGRALELGVPLVPEEADLRAVSLRHADLSGARLFRARLGGADLSGARLARADLREADLEGARLDGAALDEADLAGARLGGASLLLASAHRACFEDGDLREADLRQSTWTDCRWSGARLGGARTTGWIQVGGDSELLGTEVGAASLTVGHAGRVSGVDWSRDGSCIATAGLDGTIRLWSARTGAEMACFGGHRAPVTSVALSPDGRLVASGSGYGAVRLWDVETGEELARLEGHRGFVLAVAFSHDGDRVASAGGDGTVRVWGVASRRQERVLHGHRSWTSAVAWSKDGDRVASAGGDGVVLLWDLPDGALAATLRGHASQATALAWAPSGALLASASEDGSVRLWRASDGAPHLCFEGVRRLFALAWSPDGSLLAAAEEGGGVTLLAPDEARAVGTIEGSKSRANALCFSPPGSDLAGACDDGTVRIWRVESRREEMQLAGTRTQSTAVAWCPRGERLASASDDGTVRVWDATSGEERARLEGHGEYASWVAWSKDGGRLAAGSDDGTVRIWDPETGEESTRLAGRVGEVNAVAFAGDEVRLACAAEDDSICLWAGNSEEESGRLAGHQGPISCLAWDSTGTLLASAADDGTARIWDPATRVERACCAGHRGRIGALAWAPGDRLIACGTDDGLVRVWGAKTGKLRGKLVGHGGRVNDVAWSPDGTMVASASDDGTARLWHAMTGEALGLLEGHVGRVDAVAWAPSGDRLATACDDGTVRLWWWPGGGPAQVVLELTPGRTLARTPGGFCTRAGGGPLSLALPRPGGSGVLLFRPIGGLATVVHRPDKVAAALARDLAGDDLGAALAERGWSVPRPWDGRPGRVPPDAAPVGAPSRAGRRRRSSPPLPGIWSWLESWLRPRPAEEATEEPAPARAAGPQVRPNPFRPFAPLPREVPPGGRDELLAALEDCLRSGGSVALTGPRRSGKTTVAERLAALFEAAGGAPRVVSLALAAAATPDEIARAVAPELAGDPRPAEALLELLDPEGGRRPVVVLDDASALAAAPRPPGASPFPWLRALGERAAGLVFVASEADWDRVSRRAAEEPEAGFGLDLLSFRVGPLPREAALALLVGTAPEDVPIAEGTTARWILDRCGPWPFYLQVLGHAVVSEVRRGRRGALVHPGAVDELYRQVLLEGHDQLFRTRWAELPGLARAALLSAGPGRLPEVERLARPERAALREAHLHSAREGWLVVNDLAWLDWVARHHGALARALWDEEP